MDFSFTKDQELLRDMVREFVKRECPREYIRQIDERGEFPHDLWEKMSEAGLHGIAIPEEYGGSGGDIISQVIVAEELARSLAGLTWIWAATSCFGGKSIGVYGTEEQKRFFLPRIARGEIKISISVTEPGGGTDVLGALSTFAEEKDDHFIINGTKVFTTGADVADYLLLLARTNRDVRKRSEGTSVFIIDAKSPGIQVRPIKTLGLRAFHTCEVIYESVRVPKENLLGEKDKGWQQFVATLNNERVILAGISIGIAKSVLQEAIEHAKKRYAFGRPIGQYQAIQHYIANIALETEMAELLTYKAAWLQTQGKWAESGLESTMAKIAASEAAIRAADRGIQILGGYGYTMEYDMQRFWRDARIYAIGPISNEMGRNYIAQWLGLPRSY
jgi:acyl-CoA dehydrogenase